MDVPTLAMPTLNLKPSTGANRQEEDAAYSFPFRPRSCHGDRAAFMTPVTVCTQANSTAKCTAIVTAVLSIVRAGAAGPAAFTGSGRLPPPVIATLEARKPGEWPAQWPVARPGTGRKIAAGACLVF